MDNKIEKLVAILSQYNIGDIGFAVIQVMKQKNISLGKMILQDDDNKLVIQKGSDAELLDED